MFFKLKLNVQSMDWDQSRISITQEQNIWKLNALALKNTIETACWQLSTYVSIKVHKNNVLIRVKTFLKNVYLYGRPLKNRKFVKFL